MLTPISATCSLSLHRWPIPLDFGDQVGLGRALATSAPRRNTARTLKALGLTHCFPTVALAEQCKRPKSHPAAYLCALQLLAAAPEHAIASEDSPSGTRAALAVVSRATRRTSAARCSSGASSVGPSESDGEMSW